MGTPGVDFSGKVECLHINGNFEVWKKCAGTCDGDYIKVEYWLIEIIDWYYPLGKTHGKMAHIIKSLDSSSKIRAAKKTLIKECDVLAEAGKIRKS